MNRLTNSTKSIIEGTATPIDVHKEQLIYLKLKSLEDLEDELGMELKVYHKLMSMLYCGKRGEPKFLYVKDNDKIVQVGILEIDYCKKKIIFYKDRSYKSDYVYCFIQYGKTFALTREELENE